LAAILAQLFPSPTIADAHLDRLPHNCHRIGLTGESMRKLELVFEISDSKLNLVFTRKAKQLLEAGTAKRYADLTAKQKSVAVNVMEEYLGK
jgi:hypothetical protein